MAFFKLSLVFKPCILYRLRFLNFVNECMLRASLIVCLSAHQDWKMMHSKSIDLVMVNTI